MIRTFLHAKIHHARVTECSPEYSGSVTIDQDLLDATGMLPNEKVLIADCENGNRFETYIFSGPRGSGVIGINGAAAKLTAVGNRVILITYCQLDAAEQATHRPKVIICDAENGIAESIEYDAALTPGDQLV